MLNTSGIIPKGHRVLVLPDQVEETTDSGIILHTASQYDRESMAQTEGTVVALGNTCYADQPDAWCKEGDRVIFAKYVGTVKEGADGKEYRIISDLDVVATIDEEKEEIK